MEFHRLLCYLNYRYTSYRHLPDVPKWEVMVQSRPALHVEIQLSILVDCQYVCFAGLFDVIIGVRMGEMIKQSAR